MKAGWPRDPEPEPSPCEERAWILAVWIAAGYLAGYVGALALLRAT